MAFCKWGLKQKLYSFARGGVAELSIMDQLEPGNREDYLRDFFEECFAFDVTGCAEPGGNGIECGIIVAGMTDEFPSAVGHGVKDFVEGLGVELAGGGHPDGAIWSKDMAMADLR